MPKRRQQESDARPNGQSAVIITLFVVAALAIAIGWRMKTRPAPLARHATTNVAPATNIAADAPALSLSTPAPPANQFHSWLSNSTDAAALLTAGTSLLDEGRTAEAALCYRRAIELKPDDEEGHFNLGVAAARLGELADAERSYRAALEIFPEYAEARNNLGNVLTRQKRHSEALVEFEKAIKLSPEDASIHNNLGRTLAEIGQLNAATNHFIQATLLDTNYFEPRANLGSAYLQLRKTNEAIAALESALQLRPDFAPVRQMLERLKNSPR